MGSILSALGPAINTLGSAYGAYKAQQPAHQPAAGFQPQAPGTGIQAKPQAALGDAAFSQIQAPVANAGEFQVPQLQLQNQLVQNPFAKLLAQHSPWLR